MDSCGALGRSFNLTAWLDYAAWSVVGSQPSRSPEGSGEGFVVSLCRRPKWLKLYCCAAPRHEWVQSQVLSFNPLTYIYGRI
jgi:hypothetical protein